MSLNDTLNLIYTQPGRVFEALRERPRFLAAALVVLAMSTVFTVVLVLTYGYENLMRTLIQEVPGLDPEGREQLLRTYTQTALSIIFVQQIAIRLISFALWLAVGAALYRFGAGVAGGELTYAQARSVWTYSTLPPLAISSLLNVVLLFVKPLDAATAARAFRYGGLTQMYFSRLLVDEKAHPFLAALLQTAEPFTLYGLFLAALGLHKVAGLSHGRAWGIVLTFFGISVLLALVRAVPYS